MPKNQSETVVVQECYPGFLEWNKHWSESFTHSKIKRPDLDCLQDVHFYYEDWVKKSKESENNLEFQKLWELVMIRSSSEATVGSIIGQHCGKNRYLTPENFSKELVLRFNLGPLHLLNGLIDEVKLSKVLKHFVYDGGRLSGKFIICMKTLIAIFRWFVSGSLFILRL